MYTERLLVREKPSIPNKSPFPPHFHSPLGLFLCLCWDICSFSTLYSLPFLWESVHVTLKIVEVEIAVIDSYVHVLLALTGTLEQQKSGLNIDISTNLLEFSIKLREVELITKVSQKVSGLLNEGYKTCELVRSTLQSVAVLEQASSGSSSLSHTSLIGFSFLYYECSYMYM